MTSTGLECGVDGLAEGLASNGNKTRNQQDIDEVFLRGCSLVLDVAGCRLLSRSRVSKA